MCGSERVFAALQRGAAALALALAGAASPAVAQETRPMKFGALTVTYDLQTWSMTSGADGFTAVCRAESCKGRSVAGTIRLALIRGIAP